MKPNVHIPLPDGAVLSIDRQIVGRERLRLIKYAVNGAMKRYQSMNEGEKKKALEAFISYSSSPGSISSNDTSST